VNLRDLCSLLRFQRPPAPHGARCLARAHSIDDVARVARRRLPLPARSYLDGGGEGEHTLRRNREAFQEIDLLAHELQDVSAIDTRVDVCGAALPLPIAFAPVGGARLIHHRGELAVAPVARDAGIPYAVSTLASTSLEDIAACGGEHLWFQLYVWGDRKDARRLVDRARGAGYEVLLLSIDVSVRSKRERELRAGVTLPRPHLTFDSLLEGVRHPAWSWHFLTSPAPSFPNVTSSGPSDADLEAMFDGSVTWSDLEWMRDRWDGPIGLKGVLRPEDAVRAADLGADVVVVSNHGGRQLDHAPASIDALPAVVDAVGDRIEVLFDSGIRRGTDIVTALASGARAVLIGRPYLYGLAAAGEAGVRVALDLLTTELRRALALVGAPSLRALDESFVRRNGPRRGWAPVHQPVLRSAG
jgi:L-lactate dehydrogenase (cytochrome)